MIHASHGRGSTDWSVKIGRYTLKQRFHRTVQQRHETFLGRFSKTRLETKKRRVTPIMLREYGVCERILLPALILQRLVSLQK